MKKLLQEFEDLKMALAKKLSVSVGEASMKAFISILEDYHARVVKTFGDMDAKTKDVKEENELLRSISGVTETDIRAKLIELGEEARFLRKQSIDVKKSLDAANKEKDTLLLKLEEKKIELSDNYKLRQKDKSIFEKDLDALKEKIEGLRKGYEKKQEDIDVINEEVNRKYLDFEKDIRAKIKLEVDALSDKIRDYCGVVSSTSQFCMERWGNIKDKDSKEKKSLGILSGLKKHPLDEITPDLELLNRYSREVMSVLDIYDDITGLIKPKLEKMSWQSFFDRLKKKYFDLSVRSKIRVTWPAEKKFPEFASDEKMLFEIIDIIIQNSIESLPQNGEITITGEFSLGRTVLKFGDNGIGIKKEDESKIFLPFFTTKPGHKGIGLFKALKMAEALKGGIKYEPGKVGSFFVLDIPRGIVADENKKALPRVL